MRRSTFALAVALMVIVPRHVTGQVVSSPSAPGTTAPATNQIVDAKALAEKWEQIRTACINGRRRVCGRVLQIIPAGKVPGGLVVESGYTNLLRQEFSRSWVAPSNISTSRPKNLVEQDTPGAVCVGLVYLTDIPKRPAVKLYDYVILEGYPAGRYTYSPVTNITKTIRRFSGGLVTAVQLNLDSGEK